MPWTPGDPNPNDENTANPLWLKYRDGTTAGPGTAAKLRPDGKLDSNFENLMRWSGLTGAWHTREYAKNEVVNHIGLTWVAIGDTTAGDEPGASLVWEPLTRASGELWNNTAGITGLPTIGAAIPLTLASSNNPFLINQGAGVLEAKYAGSLRVDITCNWSATIGNNGDAYISINPDAVTGTPTLSVAPINRPFTSSRGDTYRMSESSFGVIVFTAGDRFRFVASSNVVQSGTSDLLSFAMITSLL